MFVIKTNVSYERLTPSMFQMNRWKNYHRSYFSWCSKFMLYSGAGYHRL